MRIRACVIKLGVTTNYTMATELSCGAKCCRVLFIILNSLFLFIGLVILALGIWLLVRGSDLSFVTGSSYASGAAVIVVIGAVTAIICVVGCLAGIKLWRILLVVFVVFLVLLLFLEIAAAVLGFVFNTEVTNGFVKERFESAFQEYTNASTDDSIFVNAVQNLFHCCGVNNYTDYFNTRGICNVSGCIYPPSCTCTGSNCVTFSRSMVCPAAWNSNACDGHTPANLTVYNQGCYTFVLENLNNIGYVAGGIGIIFGFLEIVAIFVSCGLIICIWNSEKEVSV